MSQRTAYVLGCQRSGTTLLRFLLGAHRDVRSVDEAAAYPVLTGARRLDEVLAGAEGGDAATANTALVYKIPRFTEQLLYPDVRDEAYGTSPQFYRGERCVLVVRDPRDVVASMCTLRADRDTSWISTYGRQLVEHRLAERPDFAARHGARVERLRRDGWPDHRVAALYWRIKNEALPAYLAAHLPILPIAYERLVASPRPVLQAICTHLGLPWDDTMLAHERVEHDQLDDSGLAIGNSDPKRAIDRASVGRHRDVLSAEAIAAVEADTCDLYDTLRTSTAAGGETHA